MNKIEKSDYIEVLDNLFSLFYLLRLRGPLAIEAHIEKPNESDIFRTGKGFLLENRRVLEFICETFLITLSCDVTPADVESLLTSDLAVEELTGDYGPMLTMVKASLVALQKGIPPLAAVEFGRRSLPLDVRPSFTELDACCSSRGAAHRLALFGPIPSWNEKELLRFKDEVRKNQNADPLDLIALLDDREVQRMLNDISNENLILVLKVAKPIVMACVFKNVSQRAGEMIWTDMNVIDFDSVAKPKVEAAIEQVKAAILKQRQSVV
jgi:hypothetical protein